MPQNTDLNQQPYQDDFDITKGYNRVLHKPGLAVQARELTQAQTILQNQIEQHGRHFFKEGAIVIPGNVGFDTQFHAVKLNGIFGGANINGYVNEFVGARVRGQTSEVVAEVIMVDIDETGTDPITLFVKYIESGGIDRDIETFMSNESLEADRIINNVPVGTSVINVATETQPDANDHVAIGSTANIESGVIFIRGHFVYVPSQRIILDKYTNTPSYRVGLEITENLVSQIQDATLLDNSAGFTNFNAPGADRLQFELTLSKKSLTTLDNTDIENFVDLIQIRNGDLLESVRNTEYNILETNLARSIFDESGNFTVNPFQFSINESLNTGQNDGVYDAGLLTDEGNTPSETLMSLQVSPGKAYVEGYSIDSITSRFLDAEKPRTTEILEGQVAYNEYGNYVLVDNVHGLPDTETGLEILLQNQRQITDTLRFSEANRTAGAGNIGSQVIIGVARARLFEEDTRMNADSDNNLHNSYFRLHLFDIQMFTIITLSSSATIANGDKITDAITEAYGYVHSQTGNSYNLTNITGSFGEDNRIRQNDSDNVLPNITINSISNPSFDQVKRFFSNTTTGVAADFTADAVLQDRVLSGNVSVVTGSNVVRGFGTQFIADLRPLDFIILPTETVGGVHNLPELHQVDSITDNNTLTLATPISISSSANRSNLSISRNRAALENAQQNIAIRRLAKPVIKSIRQPDSSDSDISISVQKTFSAIAVSNGLTFNTTGNEFFSPNVFGNYTLYEADTGRIVNLDQMGVSFSLSNNNQNLNIQGDGTSIPDGNYTILATVQQTQSEQKIKTARYSSQLNIRTGSSYGNSFAHEILSLGTSDVFRLHAVYESADGSDANSHSLSISNQTGTLALGDRIVGESSDAIGTIINITGTNISYVLVSEQDFQSGEIVRVINIANNTSTASFTAENINGTTSTLITDNFILDNGQRDNYYEIASLQRRPGISAPQRNLLVIYDFFEHSGNGNFFSVDSYNPNNVSYLNIPTYSSTQTDNEFVERGGEYDLRNCLDFRPTVAQTGTNAAFGFGARTFSGTGSSTNNNIKNNTSIEYDIEWYLPRIDSLFVDTLGNFILSRGTPAEIPQEPKAIDNAMKLAVLTIPAYVLNVEDVTIEREINKRYTMQDIGQLETRMGNIEYNTLLNLLERETNELQIQDGNGFDRFKSGFVVDNFSGHGIGDVRHPDYRIAMDMENEELRPKFNMKAVKLREEADDDNDRTASGYQKTGDLITLPYSHVRTVHQPYATRIENLNPVLNFTWAGVCNLSPSGDEWFETTRAPDLIINREGNFDTVFAQNRNSLGTFWNSWRSQWTGTIFSGVSRVNGEFFRGLGRPIISRTRFTQTTGFRRTGTNTRILPQIELESQGDKIIQRAVVPFIRSNNVAFVAMGLKPNTRVWPFFDKVRVNANVTPTSGADNGVLGGRLITDGRGVVRGTFEIPNPNIATNRRFRTGDRVFRLTSSNRNDSTNVVTFAQGIYSAKGTLNTIQENIVATRNARIEVRNVAQTTNTRRTIRRDRVLGWFDPLAQSFLTTNNDGEFITKVDLFMQRTDNSVPMMVQIREMVNGYPTQSVVPFSTKVINPQSTLTHSNVVSTDGLSTFTQGLLLRGQISRARGIIVSSTPTETILSNVNGNFITGEVIENIRGDNATATLNSGTFSALKVSENSSEASMIEFDSPVYLKGNTEYALVLVSNSQNYRTWIAQMGEQDVLSQRVISEQPYLGVLFKSQNNSTWESYDFLDLKFNMYRASFTAGTTANAVFRDGGVATGILFSALDNNPMDMTAGDSLIKVNHEDHQMFDTRNNVVISGATTGVFGELRTDLDDSETGSLDFNATDSAPFVSANNAVGGELFLRIDDEIINVQTPASISNGVSVDIISRGAEGTTPSAHDSGAQIELYSFNGIKLSNINKTHTSISNIGLDSYTIDASDDAVATIRFGGDNIRATENASFDSAELLMPILEYAGTNAATAVRTTSGKSLSGNEVSFIRGADFIDVPSNDTFHFQHPQIVCSRVNENNLLTGLRSLEVRVSLRSDKEHLSPVIDTDRTSFLAISNRLTNIEAGEANFAHPSSTFFDGTVNIGDSTDSVYITRKIALENPATSIRILFDSARPDGSIVRVFYKVSRDDGDIDALNWVEVVESDVALNPSEEFLEYQYTVGTDDSDNGDPLPEFVNFSVKLQLSGNNSASPPRVKRLRIIALA